MNAQTIARDVRSCTVCDSHTEERCSFCLLPLCPEHGQYIQPWYTLRQVLVCTQCQEKLVAIVQEEESW